VSLFLSKKRLTPLLGCSKLNIIPWHPAFDCKIARCADLSSQVKMAVRALVGFVLTVPHAALGQSTSIWDTLDAAALNQQATQLDNQGRYSEAVPLAQRALGCTGESFLGRPRCLKQGGCSCRMRIGIYKSSYVCS
jgi:hypothetical protein